MTTSTRSFGSGNRESHDAELFYSRFDEHCGAFYSADHIPYPKKMSASELERRIDKAEGKFDKPRIIKGDARHADDLVPRNSVALIVTSPPYYVGKDYEIGGNSPASWGEYLDMLLATFVSCWDVLEPGGRIAINVANLGRSPYRSLSARVIEMLEHYGYRMRGEIIWRKAETNSGSCAWGSFKSPANPVLRDVSERILVASKGNMGRLGSSKLREQAGYPHESTISRDEFLEATLDIWNIPPESARNIGHPAPFPVELPRRLIELYTYKNDLVLDPFLGSGTTLLAATSAGRRGCGLELKQEYIDIAIKRLNDMGIDTNF